MRSTKPASVLWLAAALSLAGCNNTTPSRIFAAVNWKMRCPNAEDIAGGCSMGCSEGPARGVNDFAGDNGVSLTCSVTETGSSRVLNFRAATSTGQSITLQNVTVPTGGGSALSGTVRFREDNDYTGLAGGNPPSAAQPCQISNVTFERDVDTTDTVIRGEVRCRQMRADADNRIFRGLTDPNGALVTATAVEFQVFACPGLVLAAP